jgi:hypothetical protein
MITGLSLQPELGFINYGHTLITLRLRPVIPPIALGFGAISRDLKAKQRKERGTRAGDDDFICVIHSVLELSSLSMAIEGNVGVISILIVESSCSIGRRKWEAIKWPWCATCGVIRFHTSRSRPSAPHFVVTQSAIAPCSCTQDDQPEIMSQLSIRDRCPVLLFSMHSDKVDRMHYRTEDYTLKSQLKL